jgi:hypothetical protein
MTTDDRSPKKEPHGWLADRGGVSAAASCLAAVLAYWLLAGGGYLDWRRPQSANQVLAAYFSIMYLLQLN